MTDSVDEVKRWRMRAEELRTIADQVRSPARQEMLRRTAQTYDALARGAESRLGKAAGPPIAGPPIARPPIKGAG
jgi:hypothetical protein